MLRLRHLARTPYQRDFTDDTTQGRFVREIVFGARRGLRYYQLTTDPKTQPKETTCYLLTNLPGRIQRAVGNIFGLRTWIEHGFKQAKDELRWADYRLTEATSIERWWEVVMYAYTSVSRQSPDLALPHAETDKAPTAHVKTHPPWDHGQGWMPQLNNFRLLLQPFICTCLLLPWLHLLPLPHLHAGLLEFSALMNTVRSLAPT